MAKTVTLLSASGMPLAICSCSGADAAALVAAIEAAWAGGSGVVPYTLPGTLTRRLNLVAVALYGVQ